MVDAEIATGPPDSGDDFVDDQQDIVAIADLTDPPEVAVRGRQGAERPAGPVLDASQPTSENFGDLVAAFLLNFR